MKTNVIILAAGQGTRLRPLSNDIPKCLVEFSGMSLLGRQISTLKKAKLSNIHIVTGYCADKLSKFNCSTTHNKRFNHTNMVESLFCAKEFFNERSDLIITYGDIIYQLNNLQAVLSCKSEVAVMVDMQWKNLWDIRMDNPLADAETLKLDASGYISELGQKPESLDEIQGQYTGLIKIRSDKVKDLIAYYSSLDKAKIYDGQDFNKMYLTSFIQLLINDNWKVKAVPVNNGWLEVDTTNDLLQYETLNSIGKFTHIYNPDK